MEPSLAYELTVNGNAQSFDVPQDMPLLWVLRDVAHLTGTKFGCGIGLCGACTVHIDGHAARSCITPISAAVGKKITTVEGVGANPVGHAVQQAWCDLDVPQCGYCQPGQVMAATALLTSNPHPTDDQIDEAMSGNICRCGTYPRIRAAIKRVAEGQSS
jgi:isoquinoline 1-oxidoreductase alpha subunit